LEILQGKHTNYFSYRFATVHADLSSHARASVADTHNVRHFDDGMAEQRGGFTCVTEKLPFYLKDFRHATRNTMACPIKNIFPLTGGNQ